ncbi:MAG: FMN-binding protein [Chitinivibrionales bacterium]
MSEIIKLAVALAVVCIFSGIVIAFSHSSFEQQIEAQKLREEKEAVSQVFPPGARIIDTAGTAPLPARYWVCRKETKTIGYAFALENRGHSGIIRYIVGIDTLGRITGMKILLQSETPGLGARIEEPASEKSLWNAFGGGVHKDGLPWFTEQFNGINASKPLSVSSAVEWPSLPDTIKREFTGSNTVSAITGATVSTRAIVAGLEKTVPACYAAIRGAQR